jgi:hypothetical protein
MRRLEENFHRNEEIRLKRELELKKTAHIQLENDIYMMA